MNSKEDKGPPFRPAVYAFLAAAAAAAEPGGAEPTQTTASLNTAPHKHHILTLMRYWGVPGERRGLVSELDVHKSSRAGRYIAIRMELQKGTKDRPRNPRGSTSNRQAACQGA